MVNQSPSHFHRVSAAVVMSTAYGYDIQPKKDYLIEIAEDATVRICMAMVPGARLVNHIPILRYLPTWFLGAEFQRFAADTKKLTTQMKEIPFKWTQKKMVNTVCIIIVSHLTRLFL